MILNDIGRMEQSLSSYLLRHTGLSMWEDSAIYQKDSIDYKQLTDFLMNHLGYEEEIHVEISPDVNNEYWIGERLITINSKQTSKKKFFCLIHEIGHYTLRKKREFNMRFPKDYVKEDKQKKTKQFVVDTLREEVLAWEEGLNYAEGLGIDVDMESYNRQRTAALYKYIEWAVKK